MIRVITRKNNSEIPAITKYLSSLPQKEKKML